MGLSYRDFCKTHALVSGMNVCMHMYVTMLLRTMYYLCMLPVADPSVVNTCTVVEVDDESLRTNSGCTNPLSSSILYVA